MGRMALRSKRLNIDSPDNCLIDAENDAGFFFSVKEDAIWSWKSSMELEHEEDKDNPPNIASLRSSQLKEFVKGVSFDLSDKEILCLEEQQVFDNVYSLIRSFASLPSSSKSNLVEILRSNLAVLLPNVDPLSCISDEDIPITSHHNAFKIYRRPFSSSFYHENFEEAIHLLCQQKRLKEAVKLLHRIDRPSARVYSTLIAACVRHRALELGRRVHAHTKASNFLPGVFISNRFLDLYSKCGCIEDAQMLFDEMGHRDLCSWNTMIAGYAKLGRLQRARKLFDEMTHRDNFSWNVVMSGYVGHGQSREALELFPFHSSGIAKNHF
ncbi:hypothetical protein RJT34_11073 [Clitoria ternatea]|uniref:Pentatricopeptide repeat-containing protein n=1 Tax=Clitoria ternatea TaxID=43366 RepID=A0AAN9JJT4_CLITE